MRFLTATAAALGMAALGLVSTATDLRAADSATGDQPYGIGFAWVGMSLDELTSSGRIPEGRRILCDADADNGLNSGDREVLRVTDAQSAAGLTRCSLYAQDDKGAWINRRVGVAGQPAEFYILSFSDQGVRRIMQIQLFQANDALTGTMAQLTKDWGQPVKTDTVQTQWRNGVSEATMARKNDGFYLYISDKALQRAMREKLGLPTGN